MTFFAARKGERRAVFAGFLTLFALIASHSLLETARDALFLARVPATRLPWMFLAIAGLSLGTVKLDARLTRGKSPRFVLMAGALSAALLTLGFYLLQRRLASAGVYALYVWSGLLTTLLLVHFWDLVSARFTITQAKRLYGLIGAGGVAGAIAGSAAASVLSRFLAAESLVVVAACGFATTAFTLLIFEADPPSARSSEPALVLTDSFRVVARDPYARQLVSTLFVATVCLTVSDFVFKSAIAELVPKGQLGTFLGSIYLGVNVLSLFGQLWFVNWVLKRLSLGAALGVLPALLVVTGFGVLLSSTLLFVIALKAADGGLRYSLHRTTSELLFFPFGDEGRRLKAAADLLAQRGGQVLASLSILGLTALHLRPRWMALALVLLAAAWCVGALALRKPYVAVFRARSRAARSHHLDAFPELDVTSLESLLQALESDDDREVLAALDVLEGERRTQLVPALLLHHPSEPVVLRVLGILTRSRRHKALPTIARISEHPTPSVRAAAIAARCALEQDPEPLRELLERDQPEEIRATIVANLLVSGVFSGAEREQHTEHILRSASTTTKVAFAQAIRYRGGQGFEAVLSALARDAELETRRAALAAIGSVRALSLLPELTDALADERTRPDAEQALASYAEQAFDFLQARFEDTTSEANLRRRLPNAMGLCNAERALEALGKWLPHEPDGRVRFGIICALERLIRQHPSLSLPQTELAGSIRGAIERAYFLLHSRHELLRGAERDPSFGTPGHALLRDLLRDKQRNTVGRLFRLLGLLHPTEDLPHIYHSLSVSKELYATSCELLESILREPLRSAVLGLVDDGADELKLARAGGFYRPRPISYRELLARLEQSGSSALREVARFHLAELNAVERAEVA